MKVYKGLKVQFIDQHSHKAIPQYYPKVGTKGRVIKVIKSVFKDNALIQ